ncbi:uncharacterized protein LOC142331034 [Lycorma delicatula]|uniref:uncharacterized protein LOC142331034 n=1 Tax=Lycorma delicatula TaxID=130591 RepID=UPI003F518383
MAGNIYNDDVKPNFWCNLCRTEVYGSVESHIAKKNLITHVKGTQHKQLLKYHHPSFMRCYICQVKIPMSYNLNKTIKNMCNHVNGNDHQDNIENSESDNSDYSSDGDYDDDYSDDDESYFSNRFNNQGIYYRHYNNYN